MKINLYKRMRETIEKNVKNRSSNSIAQKNELRATSGIISLMINFKRKTYFDKLTEKMEDGKLNTSEAKFMDNFVDEEIKKAEKKYKK